MFRKPKPSFLTEASAIFLSFQPSLWIAISATALALALTTSLFGKFTRFTHRNYADSIWTTFCLLISQSIKNVWIKSKAHKILFLSTSLVTLFMFSLYQNGLLAQLLLPRSTELFDSPDQMIHLIDTERYKFVANQIGFAFLTKVLHGNSSFEIKFRTALLKNPLVLEKNFSKILELVANENYIYNTAFHTALLLQSNGRCQITVMTVPELATEYSSFMFHKNHPIFPAINEAIVQSLDFFRWIYIRYEKNLRSKCPTQPRDGTKPLGLSSLAGTIFLFLGGSVCAFSALLFEHLSTNCPLFLAALAYTNTRSRTTTV